MSPRCIGCGQYLSNNHNCKYETKKPKPTLIIHNCKECGVLFHPVRNNPINTLCSNECKKKSKGKAFNKYYKNNHEKQLERAEIYRSSSEVKLNRQNYMKKYAEDGKLSTSKKKYYNGNSIQKKKEKLKRYNLTIEQYDEISAAQNNVCAICHFPETNKHQSGTTKDLAVDHCHKTGKVRGLLCFRCNVAIGKMRDSVDILKSAISYLEKNKE